MGTAAGAAKAHQAYRDKIKAQALADAGLPTVDQQSIIIDGSLMQPEVSEIQQVEDSAVDAARVVRSIIRGTIKAPAAVRGQMALAILQRPGGALDASAGKGAALGLPADAVQALTAIGQLRRSAALAVDAEPVPAAPSVEISTVEEKPI